MTMATTPRYISANLTPHAATALRDLSAAMTIQKGHRVTTSQLITALVGLGQKDHTALLTELSRRTVVLDDEEDAS
jgi:hypothetical protein